MGTILMDEVMEAAKAGEISFEPQDAERFMAYEGTMREVRASLADALKDPHSARSAVNIFLYAPRLLSGMIDYGLKHKSDVLQKKQALERFVFHAFNGDGDTAKTELSSLTFTPEEDEAPVKEHADNISWTSFNPDIVGNLLYHIGEEEFHYVVMDGHDAYRPGFMVAAALGSDVCALRNSIDSGRDSKPRPLIGEEAHLSAELSGKDVLVLGEDLSTGSAARALYDIVKRVSRPNSVKVACSIWIPPSEVLVPDFYGEERTTF